MSSYKRPRPPFRRSPYKGATCGTWDRKGPRPPEACGRRAGCVLDKGHFGQCVEGDEDE